MIDESTIRAGASLRAEALASTEAGRALRLFDGPREGADPSSPTIEVFGRTALVFDRSEATTDDHKTSLVALLRELVPNLSTVVWKDKAGDSAARRGRVVFGAESDVARRVVESGVKYALRLLAHHDATFYRDMANLRDHLRTTTDGKRVLNLFAYTGSLGVAAVAGGASVVHLDKNAEFLNQAKTSYSMNGWPIRRADFLAEDYFVAARRLRKAREEFDVVLLDPPPFATSREGRIDAEQGLAALAGKVKPLVRDGGELILVNNAVFVSGEKFSDDLAELCSDGYSEVVGTVDVPADCKPPLARPLPADPTPFTHPTKIARLRVRKKSA